MKLTNIVIISSVFILMLTGIFYFNRNSSIITGNLIYDYSDSSSEMIITPVKVHIVRDDSGHYTSSRNEKNIFKLFTESNRIWKQADIYFTIEEIVITEVSFEAIPAAINGNYNYLSSHKNYNDKIINIFLVQSLNGINGLALTQINSIMVSDFTTVNDYRTIAHELGHLLELKHILGSENLMARGENGEILSEEEIQTAKENARRFQISI